MNIALVIDSFDPRRGGAQKWTHQYAARLLLPGHEVHVVTQEAAGDIERLPLVIHRLGRIHSQVGRARAAEAKLRTLDLDLIHDIGMGWYCHVLQSEDGSRAGHVGASTQAAAALAAALETAADRHPAALSGLSPLMARQFGDPERIVLAVSRMCAEHYQQYHQVDPQRIRLVYHGTDTERFSPQPAARSASRCGRSWASARTKWCSCSSATTTAARGFPPPSAPWKGCAARQPRSGCWWWGKTPAATFPLCRNQPRRGHAGRSGGRSGALLRGRRRLRPPHLLRSVQPERVGGRRQRAARVTTRFDGAAELLSEGVEGFVLADPADDWRYRPLAGLMEPRGGSRWERRRGGWPSAIRLTAIATS